MIPLSLIERLKAGRVIPLVGAGVSLAVKRKDSTELFPNWLDLLRKGARWLHEEQKPKDGNLVRALLELEPPDYLGAAARIRDQLGPLWFDFLRDQLDPPREIVADESLGLARAVWALGSKLIVTTNYDRVLQWACPRGYRDDLTLWDIQAPAEQLDVLRYGARKPTIWHLHGKIDNAQDIILTPGGYSRFYASSSNQETHFRAARATLRDQLYSRSLLAIGFSFKDMYLGVELQKIVADFKGLCWPILCAFAQERGAPLKSLFAYSSDPIREFRRASGRTHTRFGKLPGRRGRCGRCGQRGRCGRDYLFASAAFRNY